MDKIENLIMDNLLLDIKEGRYKVDNKLPSSNELAYKYGVPRMTVRKVYENLEGMGYIYSYQGRGYYLKGRGKNIELVLAGDSFTKKIKEKGYDLQTKNLFCERIPYNEQIYNELKCEKNDEIYKIGRLRIIDLEPVAIHTSYISKKTFPSIYIDGNNITSIHEYYVSKGFINHGANNSILSLSYPTSKERKYLNCGELVPVIKIENSCIDCDSNIVLEYTEIMYRGDRFRYRL